MANSIDVPFGYIPRPGVKVGTQPGKVGSGTSKSGRKTTQEGSVERGEFVTPTRANLNFVPPMEELETLLERAVSALRKGISWDRGTILNLLV